MKKIMLFISLALVLFFMPGCISASKKPSIIREECTVEQFIALFDEANKGSRNQMELQSGGVSPNDIWHKYQVVDITPQNVYDEIGCRIFKIVYDQTYVVFKGKLYPIGREFGGFGITDINTCDFDNDGQKDIVYTYSWGSGLHRSNIAVFNFTTMEEKQFKYANLMGEMALGKISDNEYKVYDAKISSRENEVYQLTKGKLLFSMRIVDNQPVILEDKPATTEPNVFSPTPAE